MLILPVRPRIEEGPFDERTAFHRKRPRHPFDTGFSGDVGAESGLRHGGCC